MLSRRSFLQTTGAGAVAARQETMLSPPVKLPVQFLFNLYTNPQEDENKPALDTWIIGPVLKMVVEFEESVQKQPLIPMGTPDPYQPPTVPRR